MILKDFTAYDTTQEWANVRGPTTRIMVQELMNAGLREDFGLGNIPEIYLKVAEKMRDAVFDLGDGSLENPQQTHSGELNTANNNTVQNIAENQYEARLLNQVDPELADVLGPFKFTKILGDDSVKVSIPARPLTTDELLRYTNIVSIAADKCGFVINPFKTIVRTSAYEYLKVIAVYGHLVPQLGRLMPFSSERVNTLLDPIESLRGHVSFMRTVVARGGPHEFCIRLVAHTWNIRRGIKVGFSRSHGKARDAFVDYPFLCLWLPQALGGIGEIPGTLVGASKDALCYIAAKRYGYYDALNQAAHVLDYAKESGARSLAKQIFKSGQTDKFKKYVEAHMQFGEKFKQEKLEEERMPIDIGDYGYSGLARRRVIRTLENSAKINKLTIDSKRLRGKQMLTRKLNPEIKDYLAEMFGWLSQFNFVMTDEIPDISPVNPTAGRDESLARLERKIGFSTIGNDQRARISNLFKLLKDNRFNPEAEFGFDALVALFTRPDIFPDIERLTSVAIRIGADPSHAAAFAASFVTSLDSVLLLEKGQKFSSGDEFSTNLDLSYTRVAQLVDSPEWITDLGVRYLIRQIAAMLIITTSIVDPVKKIRVETFGDAQEFTKHFLRPKLNIRMNQFTKAYPVNTWY